jgi:hypothetical protein
VGEKVLEPCSVPDCRDYDRDPVGRYNVPEPDLCVCSRGYINKSPVPAFERCASDQRQRRLALGGDDHIGGRKPTWGVIRPNFPERRFSGQSLPIPMGWGGESLDSTHDHFAQ